jgi:hypothetical protein
MAWQRVRKCNIKSLDNPILRYAEAAICNEGGSLHGDITVQGIKFDHLLLLAEWRVETLVQLSPIAFLGRME